MKKRLALVLALVMVFAMVGCGEQNNPADNTEPPAVESSDTPAVESSEPPASEDPEIPSDLLAAIEAYKGKVVPIHLSFFGNEVDATLTLGEDGATFEYAYNFAGNDVVVSGTISGDTYEVTYDSTGMGSQAVNDVFNALVEFYKNGGEAMEPESDLVKAVKAYMGKVVPIHLSFFGNEVDATLTLGEDGTTFEYAYNFAGNDVVVSGTISGDTYEVTYDSTGMGSQAVNDVFNGLVEFHKNGGEALEPESDLVKAIAAYKGQTVTIHLSFFGNEVDANLTIGEDGSTFEYTYNFAGNDVVVSGTIDGDVYEVTHDSTGMGSQAVNDIFNGLIDLYNAG